MTATEAQPQFSVYLGDGWPGPYLVYITDHSGKLRHSCAVEGADSIPEAATKAAEVFPEFFKTTKPGDALVIRLMYRINADGTTTPPRPPVEEPGE